MFDQVFGLPAHPLLVHAAVVFGPLLVVSFVAYALVPPLRKRLAWVVLSLSVAAPVALFLAKESGEKFLRRQFPNGMTPAITQHENYADKANLYGFIFGLLSIITVLTVTAAGKRPSTRGSQIVTYGLIAITLVMAGVTGYYIFKTGDSGARAVWGN